MSYLLDALNAFSDKVQPDVKDKAGFAQAIAWEPLQRGMPIYIRKSDGYAALADAGVFVRAFVAGVAMHDTAIGEVCTIGRGRLHLDDWTDIAGTAELAQGDSYFLAVGGGITNSPDMGATALTAVGFAESKTNLIINPTKPALL